MKRLFWIFCFVSLFFVIGGMAGCCNTSSNPKPYVYKEEFRLACGQKLFSVVSIEKNIINDEEGRSYDVSYTTRPMRLDEFPEIYTLKPKISSTKIEIIECKK